VSLAYWLKKSRRPSLALLKPALSNAIASRLIASPAARWHKRLFAEPNFANERCVFKGEALGGDVADPFARQSQNGINTG
jgi:hypothetical protein